MFARFETRYTINVPEQFDVFIQKSIRRYVRELVLKDLCDGSKGRNPRQHVKDLKLAGYPVLCDIFDSETFRILLLDMPQLQCLTLAGRPQNISGERIYGVSWGALKAAIGVPTLRELNLRHHLFSPDMFLQDPTFALPPLHTFRCTIPDCRMGPRAYPAETEALGFVLDKLRHSLERLVLSSDAAPYRVLAAAEWPRLRMLELRGDAPIVATHLPPLLSVLERMPHLRSLRLKLAPPEGHGEHVLLWPPSVDIPPSNIFSALEELVVTYPSSQDQLYSCLSSRMQSLSVECFDMSTSRVCPITRYRRDLLRTGIRPDRNTPIPRASEILAILARCRTPRIRTLRLEYYADHAEDRLLSCIVAAFPSLELLRLCRYRAEEDEEPQSACASRIARALVRLAELRTLQVHLDVVHVPSPVEGAFGSEYFPQPRLNHYKAELRSLAHVMAQILGPVVQTIAMLVPSVYRGPSWTVFHIHRPSITGADGGGPGSTDARKINLVADREEHGYWYPHDFDSYVRWL